MFRTAKTIVALAGVALAASGFAIVPAAAHGSGHFGQTGKGTVNTQTHVSFVTTTPIPSTALPKRRNSPPPQPYYAPLNLGPAMIGP